MALTNGQLIAELYVGYYNRTPDPDGFNFWLNALNNGLSLTTIANDFANSSETAALYPTLSTAGTSPGTFVNAVYNNVLNRAPDSAGLAFWTAQIQSGAVTPGAFIVTLEASVNMQSGTSDALTLTNRTLIGTLYESELADAGATFTEASAHDVLSGVTSDPSTVPVAEAKIQAFLHPAPPPPPVITGPPAPQNITLTANVDAVSISADNSTVSGTINGAGNTFSTGDNITSSAAGTDLKLTDLSTGGTINLSTAFVGISVSNIQRLDVTSGEGLTLDVSAISGLNHLSALNVVASAGSDNVTAGDIAISVVDSNGNVTTTGGSTVSVTTNSSHSINVNGGPATSSVAISGGSGGVVADVNHGSNAANTIASVSITGSHNTTTVDSDALTSLKITGESFGSVSVVAAAGARVLNLTMDGDNYTTVNDATATSVNISSINNDSTPVAMSFASATSLSFTESVGIAFANGGVLQAANASELSITGPGYFYGSTASLSGSAFIDATQSSGTTSVQLASASSGSGTQTFTGGAGQDIITIGGTQAGLVAAGSAVNNEIILNNVTGATEANIASSVISHFSTLGIEGSTAGTFDMSGLPAYTSFDVISSGGNVSFTNVTAGSPISIDNSNSNTIGYQTSDSSGSSDHVSLTIGSSTSDGISVFGITLADVNGARPIGTVNLVSNGVMGGTGSNNVTLNDAPLLLNLSGGENLNITIANSAFGTTLDASALTGVFTVDLGTGRQLPDTIISNGNLFGTGHIDTISHFGIGNVEDSLELRVNSSPLLLQKGSELGATNGLVSGPAATSVVDFETKALAVNAVAAGDVVAYTDGQDTYVAEFTQAGVGDVHFVKLVGVAATGIGLGGGTVSVS